MSQFTSYKESKDKLIDPISDEFDSSTGQWTNLICYDAEQNAKLGTQKHTDIRSFYTPQSLPSYILYMNSKSMSSFNGTQVDSLTVPVSVFKSENWTAGTVAVQSSYNYWYGLSLTCPSGSTVTTTSSKFSDNTAINLSSYDSATDYITLSLPDFPLASTSTADLGNSSIVFGNTANDYSTAANIDNIAFNASGLKWYKAGTDVTSTGWSAGDELELRIPLSKLVNTKNQIIGVQFNIKNTSGSPITFRCLAIRCASANWVYAPLDINTLWNVVAPTPSRDGNVLAGGVTTDSIYSAGTVGTNGVYSLTVTGTGVTFPSTVVKSTLVVGGKEYQIAGYTSTTLLLSTPANVPNGSTYSIVKKTIAGYPEWPLNVNNNHLPGTSSNPWPFVYKSFNFNPTVDDSPEPIDGKLQIWFNTGSIVKADSSSNYSSIDAYFRMDQRRADQTVLNNQTQAALEEIGDFTTINDSLFENDQSDYNGDLQSQLNGTIQKYLNSYVSTDQLSYFNFQIQWYLSGGIRKANIVVKDDFGTDLYSFAISDGLIKSNTDYIFMPSIDGDSFRVQIFEIYNTSIGDPNHFILVYDTEPVKDSFIYRTKGKIGWSASLKDGDSHIKSIRSRGMVYSEIKSSPIESYTPVKGVQIITESNARKEIASGITTSPFNVATSLVSPDTKKNGSSRCYRIDNAFGTWQGITTDLFVIEDFKDVRISFKLFTTVDNQTVSAMLYGVDKNVIIPLTLPDYNPNQWNLVDLIVEGENHLNGSYKLIIGEPSAQSGSTWWIDQVSIIRDQMSWYARSYSNGINEIGADDWIQTNQAMDSQYAGAVFTNAGTELQVKGLAKTPYVELSKINVIPKYATLGNFRSNV